MAAIVPSFRRPDLRRTPPRLLHACKPRALAAALAMLSALWHGDAGGRAVNLIVEFEADAVDATANAARAQRRLVRDDAPLREQRASGYAGIKAQVRAVAAGGDGAQVRDYSNLPMAVWRVSSPAALNRLLADPRVRAVHEDVILRPVSVSDLGFINQPQAVAQGASGAGTVIAVIDGGLGNNYLSYPDFGACTGVNTPTSTCRVLVNQEFYPGASAVTAHGTNVSAIALGVAPGAKLAMYNVFNGSGAYTSDILSAMNSIIANANPSTFNVVAVNLSLGDNSSHPVQCNSTNWRSPNYSAFNAPVAGLANMGITTVAAAGNSGSKTGLSDPACVPGVVSVGAVYDNAYGPVTWGTTPNCTDNPLADRVTCFSQSASYLSLLAPGSFVNAPSSAFQQSGTSQAAPHVSGVIAALRARYPAEPVSQARKRLADTGVPVTDPANGRVTPRLDMLAAYTYSTAVSLSGSGPTQAVAGASGAYTLTASNAGPLLATNVTVVANLPAGASFVSASPGCTVAGATVTCTAASLAAGANAAFTINVQWTSTGAAYFTAALSIDQFDSAPLEDTQVALGGQSQPGPHQVPLPPWALLALAALLAAGAHRHRPARREALAVR